MVKKNEKGIETQKNNKTDSPLNFSMYISCCTGTCNILDPYAHNIVEVSRNNNMPLALDWSNDILWPLLRTNSYKINNNEKKKISVCVWIK